MRVRFLLRPPLAPPLRRRGVFLRSWHDVFVTHRYTSVLFIHLVNMPPYAPLTERFWSKVDKTPGCWFWTGATNGKYGIIGRSRRERHTKRMEYAHRVAWEMVHGFIPAGMYVCHHCDEPLCVRIDHLFIGTPTDNVRDMIEKGRARYVNYYGEDHWKAKLTDANVLEIRKLATSMTQAEVAQQFGVSESAVCHIVAGRTWRHLLKNRIIPTEDQEMQLLAEWLDLTGVLWTKTFNEGRHRPQYRIKQKRLGLKPGCPDVFIFEAPPERYDCDACLRWKPGVAIELKRQNASPSRTTPEQRAWLQALRKRGWEARVCRGAGEAIDWLESLGYGS